MGYFLQTILISLTCVLFAINWPTPQAHAAINPSRANKSTAPASSGNAATILQNARNQFTTLNFDKAIESYKAYLRILPHDYAAWGQLGAAYYHAGQPRRAQQTLQRVEQLTPERSYNYYYQGLCFSLLGMEKVAQRYWEYAGWFNDESGSKATIELAVSVYKEKEDAKAKYLASSYLQRFPQGSQKAIAQSIIQSLESGKRLDAIQADERPDPDLTLYKYNRLSLFNVPHFWSIQTGILSDEAQGYQPSESGALDQKEEGNYAFLVNASLGIGPIRKKYATAFAGYSYRQHWDTDLDVLTNWFSDPFNLQAFPIRGDLLERSHQLFGDIRRQFTDQLFLGAYARVDYQRAGSSFFPSPDDNDLRIVVSMTDTTMLIPWLGWAWTDDQRSLAYLYIRKEIHNNSPDHSNKTYDFTGDTGERAISFGLSHSMEFPAWQLSGSIEAFQYEFIFNDFWLDYTRKGAILGADYIIWKGLGVNAAVGFYEDGYKLPRIKQGDCSSNGGIPTSNPSSLKLADDNPVSKCNRSDSGTLMQAGVYWSQNANLRFSGSYLMVENSSGMKEYSESRNVIRFDVTWAFPGVKRVSRMTDRFADIAFTKDTDQ